MKSDASSVNVAHLSVNRRANGRSQKIRRYNPRVVVESAKFADNRRQGRCHYRLVKRRQKQSRHQAGKDNDNLTVDGDYWIGVMEFSSSSPFGFDTSSDNSTNMYKVGPTGTWEDLENSSSSSISWEKRRFILSNYIDFTDEMKFKFVAEDISYEGDAGTGGSLVEAALDNFLIEYVADVSGLLGDINNDEMIDVLDVVLLVNMILGSEPSNYATADINNDNEINYDNKLIP